MGDLVHDEFLEVFGNEPPPLQEENSIQFKNALDEIGNRPCNHENSGHSEVLGSYCLDCGRPLDKDGNEEDIWECKHEDVLEVDNGLFVCRRCCVEKEVFSFDPEWRFYGAADNRVSKDPSRCHYSKSSHRGLEETFTSCNREIPTAIKRMTEKKYRMVVQKLKEDQEKNTVRGKRKKSIVAACLLHAFREVGEVRTAEYIREFFGLEQKCMSRGLQVYSKTFPKDRTISTSPENLLRWLMTRSGIHISHYPKIRAIAQYLEDTSESLKRSNPQSVAAAILYFYLCLTPKYKEQLGLTKNKFALKVGLSDITVTKLVKEVARVSGCQIQI